MADNKIAQQFADLPMAVLIGAPLGAAIDAMAKAAISTKDFIDNVGLEEDPQTKIKKARTVDFSYTHVLQKEDGTVVELPAKVSAPLLAIVPIPSMTMKRIHIKFDMAVTQAEVDTSSTSASAGLAVSAGWLWGKASFSGKVSHKSEQTRKTDTTAKYEVEIEATQAPIPEGLSRILNMLQAAIVPVKK